MDPFGGNSSLYEDTASDLKNDFNTIPNNDIESIIDSNRVIPRQIGTGDNRGEMTIKGLIRVIDTDGTIRLIIGYKKEAF